MENPMKDPAWFKPPAPAESGSESEQRDALLESVLAQLDNETEKEKARDLRCYFKT